MNISDLDIYNDLDGFQEQEEKKSAELLALETKYKESLETIEQMKLELKTLRKQQSTIKVNFQNLLDTAKREIKRKDLQILQLRKEKDDICFRRRNPTNWFGYQEHQHPRDADYLQQEQLNQQWEVETQHRYENPFKKKPIHTITAAQLSAKTSDDAVQTVAEVTKRQRSPVLKEDGGTPEIDKHNDKKLRFVDEQQQSAAGVTTTNRPISPVKDSRPPKIDKHYDNKLRHCGPQQHKAHSSTFTYSCSGDDNKDVASSNQTISSHSRERQNNRYNIEPRSRSRSCKRYNGYKNKYSDEEHRGSVYQRERSRGRRERLDAGDYEAHHHRRRSRSRERGRQRERHGSSGDDHEQRKRRASRGKELQLNREHHKYSKAVSDEDLRKESSHTEGSRGSSKESYKKYEYKMIERHEAKHERKSRRHSEKEALEKERTLHKSQEITFKENYKSKKCTEENEIKVDEDQKITPKEKKLTYQEKLKKLKSMETSVTNVNFCSSSEERKCLNVDENKHTKNIEAATKVDVAQKSTNTLKPMAKAFVLPYPEEELNSSEVKLTASSSTKTISTINKQPEVVPQAKTEQQSKNLKSENENINITRKDIPKNIENIKNFEASKSIESLDSKAPNNTLMATNIVSQNSNQEFGETCSHAQMESALSTPKKVALFNEIFGPSPGAQQQASSKLLTNVLQILNSSSASTSPSNFSDISELDPKYIEKQKQPSADTQIKPKDVEEYFCELKKTVAETKETESNLKNVFEKEIEELIPGLAEVEAEIEEIVSEQNEALKDEMQKNLTHLKYNDVIEIEDDSDGTDEDIVFSKVESRQSAPAINAKKLCSAESTKEVEGRIGEIISKRSINVKKPIIEIIEDIRLPTMLPIKQILKVEAENAAIETRHSENVDDITQQKEEREDENIKNDTHKACDNNNASDKTSRKKTEKHNSDEKVKTPEILTTISIDDDDQLTNEDHKKENDFQTLNILEKIDNNTTELEKYTPDKQKITAAVPGFQQKIATNISSNVLPLCKESVFKGKSTIFNNNQIRASLKGFVIPKKKAKEALDINVVQQKNLKNSTKNTDMEIMSETHNKEKIKDRNETKTNIDFKDSKNITNQKNITAIDNEAITSKDIAVDENNQQIDIIGKFETTDISKNTQKTSNNKLITAKSKKEIDPVIESVHICHKNITTAMTKKEEQRNDDILKNNMADSKDQKSLQTFSDNNKKSGTEKDDAKTEVISDKQENVNAVAKIVKEVMNKNTAIVVATINHNTQSNIQQKLVADTGINSTSSEQLKNSKVFVENVTVDYPKDPRTSSQKIHTKPNQQEKIENKLDIIGYINKSMSALIEKNQRTEDKVFTGTDSIIDSTANSTADSTADLTNFVDKIHTKIDLPKVFGSSTKTGIAHCIEDIDKANIEAKGYDENSKGTESDEKKAKDKNRKNSTQNEPEECVNYKTGRLSAKLKNKRNEDENIFTPFENIQNNRNVEDSRKMVDVKEAKKSTEKPASCKVDSGIRKPFEDQHIHDNSEDTVTFIECAKTRTKNFDNEDGEKRCNENISSKDENRKIMEHDKIISETFVSTDIPSAKTQITEQAALQKDEGAKPEKKCNIPDIENYSQIAVPDDLIVKKTVDGIVKSAGTDNSDSFTGERKTKIMHVATTAHTGDKKLFSYKLVIDDNLEHIKNVTKTEDRQSLDFENKIETKDVVKNDKNEITINHKTDTQFTFNPKKVMIKDAENIDTSDEETFGKKSAVTDYDHSSGKSEKENVEDITEAAEVVVNDENKQITLPEPASELAAEKEIKTCKHDKDTNITNELKKEMPQKPASDNEKIKVICIEKVQEDDTKMSIKTITNSKHPDIEPHKERFSTTALNVQNKADAKLHFIDNPKSSKAKFAPNSLTNAVSTDNLSQELAIRQLIELVPENKITKKGELCSQKSKHMHEVDEKEGEEEIRYSENKNYSNTTFKERNDFLQQRPTLEKLKHEKLVKDVPAEEKISNKKASPMKLKTFFKIALPSPIKERKRKHSVEKKVGLLAAKQAEYSAGVSEKCFESRTPGERKRFEENDEKPLVKRLKPNEKPTLPIKAQSVETSSVEVTLHSTSETSRTLHVKQENLGTAPKEESPVTSRKTATTPNQAKPPKSKNFRRILDSSDEDIPIAVKTNLSNIAVKTQASKADFLSPKLELKRKRTKARKLHVISVETAANTVVPAVDSVLPVSNKLLTATDSEVQTANSAQPAKNLPLAPVMPIFVRAPPTPDHAIFHSEPSGLSPEASLPQFNIPQDKQYTDIDSRLQTMFQSPPYVAPEATIRTLTAVTNKSVSTTPESTMNCNQFDMTTDETLGLSAQADQSTILDDSSKNSSFETKRLSLGNSEYRVEKVSENVVNVFITRKRHKKKSDKIAVATKSEPLLVGEAALV